MKINTTYFESKQGTSRQRSKALRQTCTSRVIGILILSLFFLKNSTAQNLILNPGFEEHWGNCIPFNISTFEIDTGLNMPSGFCGLKYWNSVSTTGIQGGSTKINNFSFHLPEGCRGIAKKIYPHSDSCCVNLALYCPYNTFSGGGGGYNYRELLEGRLIKPMVNGHHYVFSVWVHLMDTIFWSSTDIGKIVAINSFSALFSDTLIRTNQVFPNITHYTPQVQINQLVADTAHWVNLTDTFQCEGGGEKYVILGNFKSDGHFQVQLVDSLCPHQMASVYFFDDVSLIDLDSASGVEGIKKEIGFVIYPNPATNQLTVSGIQFSGNTKVEIENVLGQVMVSLSNHLTTDNCQLTTANLPSGIYILKTTDEKGFVHTAKFVKE